MSNSVSSTLSVCTIEIGTPGTFTNDATCDISSVVNAAIEAAPAGSQINLIINPGTYDVVSSILLPSNTSVTGEDATLLGTTPGCHIMANADSSYIWSPVSTIGNYGPNTVTDTNISIKGLTFIEGDQASFGIFFTNAENIDIQNNVFIGGTDAEALVNVVNADVANNVAAGMQNAAYDAWNGPTNVNNVDNIAYIYGAGASQWSGGSGWDVLLNGSPSGDPSNPGNAVNDGIVDNVLSSSWANSSSVYAGALLPYGPTYESQITQQGNITEGMSVPNTGSANQYGPVSASTIQDDSFVGLVSTQGNNQADVLAADIGSTASPNGDVQVLGNLVLGLYSANTDPAITNGSSDPSTLNNAVLGQNALASQSIAAATGTSNLSSDGNITGSGNYLNGSGVIPALDIAAPPTLFTEPNAAVGLSGVSLEDTATGTIEVTITTQFGTLSFGSWVSGLEYGTINGEPGAVLTGNLDQINADLGGMSFTSNAAGWDDNIEINASDSEGNLATRYIPVIVSGSETSISDVITISPGEIPLSQTFSVPESYSGLGLPVAPNLGLDTVIGASGDNVINMGSSTSIVFLEAGNDTIFGGQAPAYIATGSGKSFIDLLSGGDTSIAGGSGPMTVSAATGNDVIDTGAANASVSTGSGSSTVVGGLGALTVNGGTGSLYLATLPQDGGTLTANLGSGNTTVFALSGNDNITTKAGTANFVDLGIGNDCVVSAAADVIITGAGNDTINASSGGSDSITGGSGSLYFVAGTGNSFVHGGSGSSTVACGTGNMTVQGDGGAMYISTLPQDGGNLTAMVGWSNATINALSGNDFIATGLNRNDFIDLGAGNDCVRSSGYDTIVTGAGNDTINASFSGSDSIVGGSGSLYFIAGTGNSVVDPASQSTIIAGSGNLTVGASGGETLLQVDQIPRTSRVITVDYSGANIPLIGYGNNPIVDQSLSSGFLHVTLSDGTLLQLYDPQSMNATVLSGTLSLTPWSNLKNPDIVNIDSLLGNAVPSGELNTSLLQTAASEVPSGKTAVLTADLPSYTGLSNNGTVVLDPTYLTLVNPLTGSGVVQIDTGSGLAVEGSVASTQTISFTGTDGSLVMGDVRQFFGTLSGFMGNNTIDLSNIPFSGSGFATLTSGNVLEVIENGETAAIQLDPNQSYAGNVFSLSNDGLSGTSVVDATDFTVPSEATTLFVNASAAETIVGNGMANFVATFTSNSNVTFNSHGGSGTIAADGTSNLVVSGQNWIVNGGALGGDAVAALANGSQVNVFGVGANSSTVSGYGDVNSNVISMGAENLSVSSDGSNDLITSFEGASGVVSINNGGHMVIDGGAVTVVASATANFAQAAFGEDGGQLDFINRSNTPATVVSSLPTGAIGGSTTVFGGAGGGLYEGGLGPNNSLVGGSGLVKLYSAGNGDYLEASGTAPGGYNVLTAGSGNATLVGTAQSDNNIFTGGTGSDVIISSGKGAQQFFVGALGSEKLTGSTVSGATNSYYFLQDSTGGGQDIITNFRLTGASATSSHLYINPFGSDTGVSIAGIQTNFGAGGGVIVSLTDHTSITLYGVSLAQADASTLAGGKQQLGDF